MKRLIAIGTALGLLIVAGSLFDLHAVAVDKTAADKKDSPGKKEANHADTKKHEPKHPLVKPPTKFNKLKSLVGKWEGVQNFPEKNTKVTVEYTLTSAGTVLVEKLMAGTEHEMLSLYHGDQDKILMTHYCALGNQPRMKLAKSKNDKQFKFEFLDGTSMKSDKDPHMHQLTITFVDNNHIKHDWVFFDKGKKNMTVQFDLKRKK